MLKKTVTAALLAAALPAALAAPSTPASATVPSLVTTIALAPSAGFGLSGIDPLSITQSLYTAGANAAPLGPIGIGLGSDQPAAPPPATLGEVQGMIGQANQHADEVAAMAAATSMPPMFGPKGYSLTAATAGIGGQSAVGIGFARAFQFRDHPAYWQISTGFNGGSGQAMLKVGASIGW